MTIWQAQALLFLLQYRRAVPIMPDFLTVLPSSGSHLPRSCLSPHPHPAPSWSAGARSPSASQPRCRWHPCRSAPPPVASRPAAPADRPCTRCLRCHFPAACDSGAMQSRSPIQRRGGDVAEGTEQRHLGADVPRVLAQGCKTLRPCCGLRGRTRKARILIGALNLGESGDIRWFTAAEVRNPASGA